MPQINTALLLAFTAMVFSLSACGDTNSKVVFSPESGKHPDGWATGHKSSVNAETESCFACHGENLDGGISKVSCTECHLGNAGAVHPGQWGQYAYARHQAYVATNGTASCANAACHGTALSGVPGSGPSCVTACHLGGAMAGHPAVWALYSSHANYVQANGYDTKCNTAACHGTDSNGVFLSGPSCNQCHLGGIIAVHPATATSWTSAHQGYVLPGLTIEQTRAKCDIAACHGTFNDATKPGQVKVDKTCGASSCHLGDKN